MKSSRLPQSDSPLVAIVGPTASGKSALGVWLAERLSGEVLACDSAQVYRHFAIGTAKPSAEEQRRVPHHLLDIVEPHEPFTAGEYRLRALTVLEDLRRRGKLPIITAGTGLYLRALLEGLTDAPTRSEELRSRLNERARQRGPEYLHRLLARLDCSAAARIAPRDVPKVVRAIEVCLLTGKPISEVHRAGRPGLEGFAPLKIGLLPPRSALYERIDERVARMLEAGWLEELKALEVKGARPPRKPFEFIGYRELRAHLAGQMSLPEAVQAIEQLTRRYAKRQITWFRKEPGVCWFQGFGDDPKIASAILTRLEEQLSQHSPPRSRLDTDV